MKITMIGAGGIGSTFAFQLAQAGHAVTVVARGKRLEQLLREQAIVLNTGERMPVQVSAAFDLTTACDLVLVTVLAHQVDELLPALASSAAKQIMFMFNTFEPLDRLRDAVGAERFAFGFPAIMAILNDGKLTTTIVKRGQTTIATDASWAKHFTAAGIPTAVEADMHNWLRTHAVMVAPIMTVLNIAYLRQAGVTWREAQQAATAMSEGFALVRRLGNRLTPAAMRVVDHLPTPLLAALLWMFTRIPSMRPWGAAGTGEPRALIDRMIASASGQTPALLAIRPGV